MRYISFLFYLLLLSVSESRAQSQGELDSLVQRAEQTTDPKHRLKLYGDLCWGYSTVNTEKALYYGNAERVLAEKLRDSTAIALAYSDIGNVYTRINQLQDALEYHLKAYHLRIALGLTMQAAGSVSNIAVIYKQQGNYKEALEYMYRALRIYEAGGDGVRQALVLNNIGNVYMSYLKFDAAADSYQQAIALAKKTKSLSALANAYGGLFKYHYHQKAYKTALQQAIIAEKYLIQLNMQSDLATIYNNMGQAYDQLGNSRAAMQYYERSLATREAMGDRLGMASCYKNMAVVYMQRKDYAAAKENLDKSIALFKAVDAKDYLREAYDVLGQLYEQKNDYGQALVSFKGSVALKDSIYSRAATDKINELEIAYQTVKKNQQIESLRQQNEIQKLTISRRNSYLGLALALMLTLLLVAWLRLKNIRLKEKAKMQQAIMQQQDLATKAVLQAEENERKRISAELHDGLGQLFSAVKMNLSALADDLTFKHTEGRDSFEKTLSLVDESCREVRVIAHQMAPNVLLKSGLATAIRDFIHKIDARKLKINLETVGLSDRLDQNVEIVLYRVIQEAVNNVIKHSGANILDIQLLRDEEGIQVMIEDNGKGFDTAASNKTSGLGLKNIRSRIEYLKGQVDFSSSKGAGTLVAIHIPL